MHGGTASISFVVQQLRLLHGNQLLEKVSMQKTREAAKLEKKAEKQKHVQNQLEMVSE